MRCRSEFTNDGGAVFRCNLPDGHTDDHSGGGWTWRASVPSRKCDVFHGSEPCIQAAGHAGDHETLRGVRFAAAPAGGSFAIPSIRLGTITPCCGPCAEEIGKFRRTTDVGGADFPIEACVRCGATTRGRIVLLDGEEAPARLPEAVNHPAHYKTKNGLEAIDVVEGFELGFNLGNAFKYIARAGKKGGDAKMSEDLKKARWYLDREIALIEQGLSKRGSDS